MARHPLHRQGQSTDYMEYDNYAQVGIDFPHHQIHEGNHFFASDYVDLNTAGTLILAISTASGTGTDVHFRSDITAAAATTMTLYEGATVSGGTTITAINNNRGSSNTSELTIVKDPTITVSGTVISNNKVGSTSGNPHNLYGGHADRDSELILKDNTTYLYYITSNADSNAVDYSLSWYELPSDY